MRDITFLAKTITVAELEKVKPMLEEIIEQGIDVFKAATMIYRNGYLDGKDQEKEAETVRREKRKAYFEQQKQLKNNSPTSGEIEGSEN